MLGPPLIIQGRGIWSLINASGIVVPQEAVGEERLRNNPAERD
jgi:hypothetical protein